MLLARVAPARVLSDDDKHNGLQHLGIDASAARFVVVSDTAEGRAFLTAAWNLGYAILNLGEVGPGWGGVGPEEFNYNFGYTVPFWEDVPFIA